MNLDFAHLDNDGLTMNQKFVKETSNFLISLCDKFGIKYEVCKYGRHEVNLFLLQHGSFGIHQEINLIIYGKKGYLEKHRDHFGNFCAHYLIHNNSTLAEFLLSSSKSYIADENYYKIGKLPPTNRVETKYSQFGGMGSFYIDLLAYLDCVVPPSYKVDGKLPCPAHYDKAIQPWDYISANKLGYYEGNVIKYITRYKDKGGIDDLKKAQAYITKMIYDLENVSIK